MQVQTEQAARQLNAGFQAIDVAAHPEAACQYRQFFPFLTVIDGTVRIPFPAPAGRLAKIIRSGLTPQPTHLPVEQEQAHAQQVKPLTPETMLDACQVCIPNGETSICFPKVHWLGMVQSQCKANGLGTVAYMDDQPVAATEYLPSWMVPYPLPQKGKDSAFLTCLYGLDGGPDYRPSALVALIDDLRQKGYRQLQVVSGRKLPYPNGPADFFSQYGFRDQVILDHLVVTSDMEEDDLLWLTLDLQSSLHSFLT